MDFLQTFCIQVLERKEKWLDGFTSQSAAGGIPSCLYSHCINSSMKAACLLRFMLVMARDPTNEIQPKQTIPKNPQVDRQIIAIWQRNIASSFIIHFSETQRGCRHWEKKAQHKSFCKNVEYGSTFDATHDTSCKNHWYEHIWSSVVSLSQSTEFVAFHKFLIHRIFY